ncbi:zinc finger protein 808-like [Lucilia sericata]|uniref:zinc finger protein 808-like n=1 Tax=Lucilia sericata TaxID=13632 RepID=UPI0018A876E2|nr:zinc finger protein 808-like [Lucilia sericata]
MNSSEFKDTVCRICLDEKIAIDWNNRLAEHGDITYKDCYYKYTQLECLEADPFSCMLCQKCSNGLKYIHSLILKALDSYNFLLDVNSIHNEVDIYSHDDLVFIEDITDIAEKSVNCNSTDFETVLVEKTDTESVDYFQSENTDDEIYNSSTVDVQKSVDNENNEECDIDLALKIEYSECEESLSTRTSYATTKRKKKSSVDQDKSNTVKKLKNSPKKGRYKKETSEPETLDEQNLKKKKKYDTPSMCSICSKILHNKYSLQKHERTHVNRERKVPCPVCGVKFYDKNHLKSHMRIHNENRIKRYQCEFCDKAFFERGALNVHRRIHLGQMIPCTLCSKEFFRKVDLEIHMNSHSAVTINSNGKKRSRYWVRCKYCDKNILSTSFKSHTAAHLNEPLMKCSICDKEFFRRDCCTQHVRQIHKKSNEEYDNFIITYNKNRLSHLFLEQTADLQPDDK